MTQPRKRFLYKIWSGYDGFAPSKIGERLDRHGRLRLGWSAYIDVIEKGAEVWVYFHGRNVDPPGVYAKGLVAKIDATESEVFLRLDEYSETEPLTEETVNAQVAEAVARRGRQVFFLPKTLLPELAECTLKDCQARRCDDCRTWRAIPLIRPDDLRPPDRLREGLSGFAAAYWVVPPRCYLYYERRPIAAPVRAGSDMFYEFKAGEGRLAYPLALGLYEALSHRELLDFDCIIPIPLSPDKADAGELNRTLALARELSRLLDARVAQYLSLSEAISKRGLRRAGWSQGAFEYRYERALRVDHPDRVADQARVLLLDDVCDHGSTMRAAADRLREVNPQLEIVAAAAGQMIVKEVVRSDGRLVA